MGEGKIQEEGGSVGSLQYAIWRCSSYLQSDVKNATHWFLLLLDKAASRTWRKTVPSLTLSLSHAFTLGWAIVSGNDKAKGLKNVERIFFGFTAPRKS